ncbi:hypothetical protein [Endozoicomonas lisbonensis]|uniref:Prophage maintenance system killer protein n=1 Tax=Endozoicomonas lisbonensis TaxID=3120522 RepID=A0ABV2SFF2_9GAMM
MITSSTEQGEAANVGRSNEIEPVSGFVARCFERVVAALYGSFYGETTSTDNTLLTVEPTLPYIATPLTLREVLHVGTQSPVMTSQSNSTRTHTNSPPLFTADTLFRDPLEPDGELESSDVFDDPFPAEKIADTLLSTYLRASPGIIDSHYDYKGNFYYLMPSKAGLHFTHLCSTALSQSFTEADEKTRQEAIQHFLQYRQSACNSSNKFAQRAFTDFVKGVHRSVSLEQTFKQWERRQLTCAGLSKSDTSLHKLMIEGRLCESPNQRFLLNNEEGFLERSYRAFMFLLNRLVSSPDKRLSMIDINHAAAIVGSSLCSKNAQYGLVVKKAEDHPVFIEMMRECMIFNKSGLPEDQFHDRMRILLKENFITRGQIIYTGQARQKRQRSTSYFELNMVKADDHATTFKIVYCSKSKQKDGQEVLDRYYKTIATKTDALDIVEAATEACCELQRQHQYGDGNGRIQFFMVLPILLYQQKLWLKETLDDPWDLVDSVSPRAIAEQLLSRCEPRQVFSPPLDWQAGMPEAERVRLLCAMGETEALTEAISQRPELLTHTFRPANQTLLTIAARHNQGDIVEHILSRYPESVDQTDIAGLLNYLEQSSFDSRIIGLIRKFRDRDANN